MKLLFLVLSVVATSAFAEIEADITKLPFEKCDWEHVYVMEDMKSINLGAGGTDSTRKLNEEVRKIADKATDDKAPLADQLSANDLTKLNEVIQRLNSINAGDRLEGWRSRDLELIFNLYQIIENDYKGVKQITDENDPKFYYQAIVETFSTTFPDFDTHKVVNPPQYPVCNVDVALWRLESKANKKINHIATNDAAMQKLKQIQNMAERYHVTDVSKAKLSPADKKTFDDIIENFVKPMNHENKYIQGIEVLRSFEAASEMIYFTGKQDLQNSGGDGSKIGTIIYDKVKANDIDPRTRNAIGLIRAIGQKIKPRFEVQDIPLQLKTEIK
jgi:division protein CdvB (Snf7/Vps24/ESCRT-III family)